MDAARYPSEFLRKKLVNAGIPEAEHSLESLSARIPADFHTPALDPMTADMAAGLLLYFIAKGLLTLPVSSDTALLDMPWGSHVCQFYNGKHDLLQILVPYFRQGLARNQAGLWLVGDVTVEEATDALAAAVPNLNQYLARGQMHIRHYTEFYTNPNGTVRQPDELSTRLGELGLLARSRGFEGLRVSGNVSWINNEESMVRIMDYETRVNYVIQASRIMAVCTYPARAAALCRCRELIHNHGRFLVKSGETVRDVSRDVEKIEAVFTSLALA